MKDLTQSFAPVSDLRSKQNAAEILRLQANQVRANELLAKFVVSCETAAERTIHDMKNPVTGTKEAPTELELITEKSDV